MAVAHYFLRYAIAAALFAVAADAFCQTPGACFPLAANNICGSSFVGYGINSLYFDEFPATGVNTDTFNQVMIQRYETISVVADNFISNKGCSASASSFISQNFRYQLSFWCSVIIRDNIMQSSCSCPPPAGSPVHGPALCTAQCQIATASVQSLLNDPTTCPATSNTTQSQGRTTTLGTFQTYCSTTAPADLATPNGGPCYAGVDQDVQFCGFLDATDMANGCSSLPNDPCCASRVSGHPTNGTGVTTSAPTTPSPSVPNGTPSNIGLICGVIVGALVLLGVIVGFLVQKRRRASRDPMYVQHPTESLTYSQYLQDQRHKQDMEASGTYSSPRVDYSEIEMATNGLNDSLRSPLPTASMHNSSPASGKQSPYVRPTREYTPTPPPPAAPPKDEVPSPASYGFRITSPPPQGTPVSNSAAPTAVSTEPPPHHQAARARPAAVARELPPPAAKPYTAPPPVRIGQVANSPQHPEPTVVKVVHPYVPSISDELALSVDQDVIVIRSYDDGWAMGLIPNTGKQGVFPLICTLPPEDYAALLQNSVTEPGSYSSLGELSVLSQISSRMSSRLLDEEDRHAIAYSGRNGIAPIRAPSHQPLP
ncbi:uncharacterized protein BJ171DRAFT_528801 [Polychytrium aggregatum]|uniref:uncharacterized protein n=1 Tax=Polychytrium aggregatum TaxID=110093 RepID=UPI0022FEEB3D|nr:uncharacterized protein BJ171DRAFT_528801 [Polychytrium aggregatum]KAI9193297.1 hypothetical protein BJ171DRAFT_528801 [Polychytrium aggregatum]